MAMKLGTLKTCSSGKGRMVRDTQRGEWRRFRSVQADGLLSREIHIGTSLILLTSRISMRKRMISRPRDC